MSVKFHKIKNESNLICSVICGLKILLQSPLYQRFIDLSDDGVVKNQIETLRCDKEETPRIYQCLNKSFLEIFGFKRTNNKLKQPKEGISLENFFININEKIYDSLTDTDQKMQFKKYVVPNFELTTKKFCRKCGKLSEDDAISNEKYFAKAFRGHFMPLEGEIDETELETSVPRSDLNNYIMSNRFLFDDFPYQIYQKLKIIPATKIRCEKCKESK